MLTKNYLAIYAKSFNWAGFFLPKKTYLKCSALYDFCREADNIADDENKIEVKKDNFIKFRENFVNKNYNDPVIKNMWDLINEFNISTKIIDDLFDGINSDIKENLKLNSKKELNTKFGSGFSIQPKFTQSAYFRFHNKSEIYDGLYFVGAGTHPGAGVPGVLSSAKVLDKLF